MPLATIMSAPRSPEELAVWSFAHAVSHRDIVRRIMETKGTSLPEYVLDPIDPKNSEQWVNLHYQMHLDMDQELGIQGTNLGDVDWENTESVAGFVFFNFQEHYEASRILGIE